MSVMLYAGGNVFEKTKFFAVCDLEAEYACNFMDYLNQKKNIPFEIPGFYQCGKSGGICEEEPRRVAVDFFGGNVPGSRRTGYW